MIVRFRLGNITETSPVHGKLDQHVSAGRKRDGFKQLHVSVEFTKYGNTLFRPVILVEKGILAVSHSMQTCVSISSSWKKRFPNVNFLNKLAQSKQLRRQLFNVSSSSNKGKKR